MSTHRSESNTPAITFHPIGNYGGKALRSRIGVVMQEESFDFTTVEKIA